MSEFPDTIRATTGPDREPPRLLGIFKAWRLRAYGFAIAIVYAFVFIYVYRGGGWIVSSAGAPLYTDFTTTWVAGIQALHGDTATLYNSAQFLKIQTTLLGAQNFLYPNWPYPPVYSLIMAPFALLPYFWAFVVWVSITLSGCIVVVYSIVRRSPAVALVLASPFTAWNILAGQNGFLTATLLGASLLLLERHPILAGIFVGGLSFKPQFGILFPVALLAAKQWRAIASTAGMCALLVGGSILAFGVSAWEAFPGGLLEQRNVVLLAGGLPDAVVDWGHLQTVYGLIRYLHGSARQAWVGHSVLASGVTIIVWMVWRSPARYALKAAILSAAALLATPYAFTYDLAAIAIPVAFLARDQMRCGLMRGEQIVLLGLFGAVLGLLAVFRDPPSGITFGSLPIGPLLIITILGMALHRVLGARAGIALSPASCAMLTAAR